MSERIQQVIALLKDEEAERERSSAPAWQVRLLAQARGSAEIVADQDTLDALDAKRAADGLPKAWTALTYAWLPTGEGTGRTRNRQIHVGNVVRVKGLGKRSSVTGERTTSAGWKITGIAQRGEEINVVVVRNGKENTVKIERIA